MSASVIPSAGEDKTLRRWRITLTIAAWLLIAQSSLTFITGLIGMLLTPMADPGAMLGQVGSFVDRSNVVMLQALMRQTIFLNRIQMAGSLVLLAGSIGLLLRRTWGLYAVVAVHVAAIAAVFIWLTPMFETIYRVLDPANAGTWALLVAILAALAPAAVIAFLLVRPVVSQFERRDMTDFRSGKSDRVPGGSV